MKQSLNNIDIHAIIEEIRPGIQGTFIKNVYQLDDTRFIISYRGDGNKQLFVEVPSRLHLTEYPHDKPKFPPPFCTTLRKYLKNRRVIDFYQVDHLDRVAVLEVSGQEGEIWRLIFEFFGKGNVMLLKPDNVVQVAKRYIKLRNEIVLPNKPFSFPEQNFKDFMECDEGAFTSVVCGADGTVVKAMTDTYNMNTSYAEEICIKAGVDKATRSKTLDHDQALALYTSISALRDAITRKAFTPAIVSKDESFETYESVDPFQLDTFKALHQRMYASFNLAVDDYFSRGLIKGAATKKEGKKKLSKNERILVSQREQIQTLQTQAAEHERIGTLLYQYFNPLSRLLERLLAVKKQGMEWEEIVAKMEMGREKQVEEAMLFHGIVPGKPLITVNVEENILELDIRHSLTENVNKLYYGKSKKAKRKIPGAMETVDRFKKLVEKEKQMELDVDHSILIKVSKRKQLWFEKYRWFRSSDGYLVIAGKDATSNEALYAKHLSPNDMFFHSEIPGAPVVIVKNRPDATPDDIPAPTIKEAAQFGISYSRSWKMALSSADIYQVLPEQVSKTPQTGEFLPKGSFVIRGERNYFRNVKLGVALGVLFVSGNLDLEGTQTPMHPDDVSEILDKEGPESENARKIHPVILSGSQAAIATQTTFYVMLKPSKDGDTSGAMASRLRKLFFEKINEGMKNFKFPVEIEAIQACLPPGRASIVT